MTDKPELMPCPFCGSDVEIFHREGGAYRAFDGTEGHSPDMFIIECRNKHAVRVSHENKDAAIKRWNTRTALQAEPKENKPLYRVNPDGSAEIISCSSCDALFKALESAKTFIRNGVALGFIQMPDDGVPDPATQVLPEIEKALAAHRAKPDDKCSS